MTFSVLQDVVLVTQESRKEIVHRHLSDDYEVHISSMPDHSLSSLEETEVTFPDVEPSDHTDEFDVLVQTQFRSKSTKRRGSVKGIEIDAHMEHEDGVFVEMHPLDEIIFHRM